MTVTPLLPVYRVLARKYRPRHFGELIGQDALVRTLTNAIGSGRIAHAFMLTGVRGVGKTTTARIIARALNYTGPDGKAGPTTGPTDDCEICRAIAEDRHPDVIEMDAASRRGIDEIRELIDGVRYAPVSARYKIYIIDEVHMLTKEAFNALLKTLEEPPPHVKFIFATTEIRKVPVTVLSRCQRFDLRRIDDDALAAHYKNICALEKVKAEDEALTMIARAADGSVRDGLSLLDQAIALAAGGTVEAGAVKDMLGLADGARTFDLLEHLLRGRMSEAFALADDMLRAGADPLGTLQDMLDVTHRLTRARALDVSGDDTPAPLRALAHELGLPALGRAWQILLKGISEVQAAPAPRAAFEMILIRLAYAAELPDPADLVRRLKQNGDQAMAPPPAARNDGGSYGYDTRQSTVRVAAAPAPQVFTDPQALSTLEGIEQTLRAHGHMKLASDVYYYARPAKVELGRLELGYDESQAPQLLTELARVLRQISGKPWFAAPAPGCAAPTLAEIRTGIETKTLEEARAHPLVARVIEMFPGAKLVLKPHESKKD